MRVLCPSSDDMKLVAVVWRMYHVYFCCRPRSDLDQFKPAQPSMKFEFPQVPLLKEPINRVVGFFQQAEPDRNIIPPPLHIQLKKPTSNPNAPGG